MSSTVRFTPLHPADHDDMTYTSRMAHGAGVRINDLAGLKDELSETLVSQMDTRKYTDRDEYPAKEWMILLGFSTHGDSRDCPTGGADYHNITNTDAEDMAHLWGTISKYTEPFFVYQTSFEGSWPHAAQLDRSTGSFYRVDADNGDVEMKQITVTVDERTPVDL